MNWWLNFYFGEGPGIAKDAPQPKGLRRLGATISREWFGLVQLNVLVIVCALPLFTFPAGLAAMLAVLERIDADEPTDVWRDFWRAFMRGGLRATGLTAIFGGLFAVTLFVLGFYGRGALEGSVLLVLPMALAGATLAFLVAAWLIALCLAGSVDTPLRTLLKAAAVATILQFAPLTAALAVNAAIWGLHIAGYPGTILLPVLINFSFGALVVVFAAGPAPRQALAYVQYQTRSRWEPRARGFDKGQQGPTRTIT